MIDLASEHLLTLAHAAKSLPNRPHVSTIHRWRLRGVRGVRLETLMVGGVRYTSSEALQRFFNRTTAVADGTSAPPTRTDKQREQAISRAEAELAAAGIH